MNYRNRTYGEAIEWRFLHFIRSLVTDSQDGDVVTGSQKVLGEVEANDGVAAAVGVDYEDLLLVRRGGCLDGERSGREAPGG